MTEIRTTSSTGGQKGVKPERLSLLPRLGLESIARVFGFGAEKYDSHNWRKGYEWSKSLDALQRHVLAFQDGETYDSESGLPHLAHAGFHVLVLLTWLAEQGEGGEFDDRYKAPVVEDPVQPLEEFPPRFITGIMPAVEGTLINGADLAHGMWTIPEEPKFGTLSDEVQTLTFALENVSTDLMRLLVGLPVEPTYEVTIAGEVSAVDIASDLQRYHNRR